jgi:nitrite reductase/ring-hydroxylating ferredoxin subunit
MMGVLLGFAGMSTLSVGADLGGYLSFSRGVGVNHAFDEEVQSDRTAVVHDAALEAGRLIGALADTATAVLYRSNDQIYAIGGRCSHADGALAQGTLDETICSVTCTWHCSVFHSPTAASCTARPVSPKRRMTSASTMEESSSSPLLSATAPPIRRPREDSVRRTSQRGLTSVRGAFPARRPWTMSLSGSEAVEDAGACSALAIVAVSVRLERAASGVRWRVARRLNQSSQRG